MNMEHEERNLLHSFILRVIKSASCSDGSAKPPPSDVLYVSLFHILLFWYPSILSVIYYLRYLIAFLYISLAFRYKIQPRNIKEDFPKGELL